MELQYLIKVWFLCADKHLTQSWQIWQNEIQDEKIDYGIVLFGHEFALCISDIVLRWL